MKRFGIGILVALLASPSLAKEQKPPAPCQTTFTVVQEDILKNVTQGLTKKQLEQFSFSKKQIQQFGATFFALELWRKYPGICYVPPAPDVPLVFYITVTPAVYHGTRVDEETHESPVKGTVTDEDGSTSDLEGTVKTTTSTAVPYTINYGIYTLTVETREGPGKWKARRRFQRGHLYRVVNPKDKGRHPDRTVIEEAVKWVYEGGLANPLEGVAP